jgi:SAM-dependent methyltransferase
MADVGYRVTAVDPHKPSIEHGRKLAPGVMFIHGFVSELSPARFDCVIISEVLEHLDSPETLVSASLPYLAERGLLIVTVPNGYGEFELDRRLYAALKLESVVGWLRSVFGKDGSGRRGAGSDEQSPHIQRFTLSRLREIFDRHGLELVQSRGTSLTSGPLIAHLFARSKIFIRLNAAMADHVPLVFASGWMFALKRPG